MKNHEKKHLPFPNARKAVRSMAARHPLQQRIQCLTDPSVSYVGAAPEERDLHDWSNLFVDVFCTRLFTLDQWGIGRCYLHPFDFCGIQPSVELDWGSCHSQAADLKLGCLRGSETPCKKAWNGGRNGRDVCCVALSLSLSLSPTPYQDETRNTEMRESASNSTHGWMIFKFQMPDAISQLVLEHALAPHWVGPLMKIRQEPRLPNTCTCLILQIGQEYWEASNAFEAKDQPIPPLQQKYLFYIAYISIRTCR